MGPESLPARRRKELLLEHAWTEVAGEALGRRAKVTGLRRGVLEIEVPDAQWARTIREVVPRLAGRIAGRYPDLGVKKVRVREGEDAAHTVAIAVEPLPATTSPDTAAGQDPEDSPREVTAERLERVARRYLDRGEGR